MAEIKEKKSKRDVYTLNPTQLMWRHFKKHRMAMIALVLLGCIYFIAIFAEFFAPYNPYRHDPLTVHHPPQRIQFRGEDGFQLRPFVYGYIGRRDLATFERVYEIDKDTVIPIYFFVRGHEYRLLGLFPTDIHFFGTEGGEKIFLLGADIMGRDLLSRIIYGARISTSIGFIGVILSFFLGIVIGGIAGFYGGIVDHFVQRIIEILRSIPTIPLWLGLSAAVPPYWSPVQVYIAITCILALRGWTTISREVRSKFFSLREEDFVMAARLAGASRATIIRKHMLPSFYSHIIARLTLSIPAMILGETSLSFLGLGLRPPTISWGVLLNAAQNVRTVSNAPWLLLPGLGVIITVLSFNFLGDGIRDAADPYEYKG